MQNQASSAEPDARRGDSAVRPSVRLSSVNAPLFHSRTVNPGALLDEAEHSLCESEPPFPVRGVLHRRTVTLAQLGGSYQPRSPRLIAHCAARESFCVQADSRKNLRSWSSPKRSRSVTSSLLPPPLPPPPTLAQSLSLPKASLLPNGSYASLPSPPTLSFLSCDRSAIRCASMSSRSKRKLNLNQRRRYGGGGGEMPVFFFFLLLVGWGYRGGTGAAV